MSGPVTGAVLIGRNEGDRLKLCLASVGGVDRVVYVDSGSTDGSVEAAQAAGAEVVTLDMSQPFTAARARNAGIEALKQGKVPDLVQFIDGDCELQPDWLSTATAFLEANPKAAVACGRRRERFPEASIYNRLCDREWDTPVGQAKACGGDALMRMAALTEVGGYDPTLIAGEEPEMCVRMRASGWQIWRLDAEMTLHDAAMTRFGQFWKRAKRGGHAWAEGAWMHGRAPERHGVAGTRRALIWGAALPLVILLLALLVSPWALLLLLAYPAQIARLALRDGGSRVAWEQAVLLTLGKFPEAQGALEFFARRLTGRRSGLIEYK
jgi:GT2 family glycosyltransferase